MYILKYIYAYMYTYNYIYIHHLVMTNIAMENHHAFNR